MRRNDEHMTFFFKVGSPGSAYAIPVAAYEEDLRLLKWLAFSQAVEDINSDYELA
ncbi:hypothetical protein LguiA_007593 [Lonicera macranthoides]